MYCLLISVSCFSSRYNLYHFSDVLGLVTQPLRAAQGSVFTHVVWVGGWWEKVYPGCISETLRCRKSILDRDIGWRV